MKLGIDYCVFNGIELLPYSINQIRSEVDFINVTFQEKDYYGKNMIKMEDMKILTNLLQDKIIDKLTIYIPDKYAFTNDEAQIIEAKKRKFGRDICIQNGCDYFLDLDTDEFYKKEEFIKAKKYIEDNNINYSITEYINYFKLPIYQVLRDSEHPRHSAFICRVGKDEMEFGDANCTKIINGLEVSVDKTRFYKTKETPYLFKPSQIIMHHMTGVRKNLSNKFYSYSGRNITVERNIDHLVNNINNLEQNNFNFDEKFKRLLYFIGDNTIIQVENYFGIPLEMFR